jgi:hypothetical protein
MGQTNPGPSPLASARGITSGASEEQLPPMAIPARCGAAPIGSEQRDARQSSEGLADGGPLHAPPRAVGMPQASSPSAIARNDVPPDACSSAMPGAKSAARSAANASVASVRR